MLLTRGLTGSVGKAEGHREPVAEPSNGAAVRLRVLSYNIHKAIGVDFKFRPERIIEILAHHNADIVLLQEVDRHAARSNRLDLASEIARALVYPYRSVGMNVFRRFGKYGNATLSRFPIGRQRNIDLTVAWRKPRGAQHTRVHVPVGPTAVDVDVFNVHLGLSATERAVQVQRLLDSPDLKHLTHEQPAIIGGDMNDWRGLLRGRCFGPFGFHCATNHSHGNGRSIRTFPSYAPAGGLDKVFYRGPLNPVSAHGSALKLARVASDHLPIIVEFELRTPKANS
ncbi:MAG: endonuclease/exonuclease/phosphatase family protein [Phycisphaerales bacterium]|nr:endonuclease/exonuclease/phosphatase family protein [Phycisphaerales bacterium]